MEQAALSPLSAWESFYVIIGSSAAALTGLQFVVVVLAADRDVLQSTLTTRAFATPTIVHFCAVLLVSVLISAPWHSLSKPGEAIAICGILGVLYEFTVTRHLRRQTHYKTVLEDWVWHIVFPLAAYATLAVAGILLPGNPAPMLFVVGAAAILLLFCGIHNAWDAVTYIAQQHEPKRRNDSKQQR
jgi:hypothetical protein